MTASDAKPVRVVFTPSGLVGAVPPGTTVLGAARQLGVDLDSVCAGRGLCGRCQVEPSYGAFPKWGVDVAPGALGPPAALERDYRGARPLVAGRRLGCTTAILAPVVIDVPAQSQVHHQVVRKHVDVSGLVLDPMIVLAYLELDGGLIGALDTTGSATSLVDRVGSALLSQHGLTFGSSTPLDLPVLAALATAVDKADGRLTVAVRPSKLGEGTRIVAAWPGFVDSPLGVAIDLGSTTIAAHLCDLSTGDVLASKGRMNPQIRFGEDLMSRVSYVMMHPDGARVLTAVARAAIDELVSELLDDAGQQRGHVLELVIVANPIMHHIVLGLDPTPLGQAPFPLVTSAPVTAPARELDLNLPWARVYAGPCIAGHVGADTSAAMLAEGPHRSDVVQLLIDIGTNAEIVLGDRHRLFAASSPTGPAFEGAQISCGQRATVGAIERVRIDRYTLEPRFKVIGCELWSDDPGFAAAAATAEIEIVGVCGSGIVEVIAELFLAGVIAADGTIVDSASPRVVQDGRTRAYVLHAAGPLLITQNDVRAIQLAKAALRAGIDLLIERSGQEPVDVRLAGAFGAHLDPIYAMVLGLLPDGPVENVRSVGNAAGNGAVRALLSGAQRAEMEHAARRVVKIETAIEPRFQELFVAAMAFPHASAPTPYLGAAIVLPIRSTTPEARTRRRTRSLRIAPVDRAE